MRMRSGLSLTIFAGGVLFSSPLPSQTPDTAVIRGTVVDSSHAAVKGAEITLLNRTTSVKRTLETDESGTFSTGGLPVGDDSVTARKRDSQSLTPKSP
jgi:Carboxypeptidase regulatory-like domain